MLTYKKHTETPETKGHTDIMLNGSYIGYFINKSKTVFIELNGEIMAGTFKSIKQIKEVLIKLI